MGSSFVGLGDRGFWMRDGHLELWLRLLALHIEDPSRQNPDPTATKIRDQWLLASRGFFNGCVPVNFEEAVATEKGKAVVRGAIDSLLKALRSAPVDISKDALNLLGFEGTSQGDVERWRLIEIGQAFLDLLDGKIKSDPRDTTFMPGLGKSDPKRG